MGGCGVVQGRADREDGVALGEGSEAAGTDAGEAYAGLVEAYGGLAYRGLGGVGDEGYAEESVGWDGAFVVADRGGDVSGGVGALAVAGEEEIGGWAVAGDGRHAGVGAVDAGLFGG